MTDLGRRGCQFALDARVIVERLDYLRSFSRKTAIWAWHEFLGSVPEKERTESSSSFHTAGFIVLLGQLDEFTATVVSSLQDDSRTAQAVTGWNYVMKSSYAPSHWHSASRLEAIKRSFNIDTFQIYCNYSVAIESCYDLQWYVSTRSHYRDICVPSLDSGLARVTGQWFLELISDEPGAVHVCYIAEYDFSVDEFVASEVNNDRGAFPTRLLTVDLVSQVVCILATKIDSTSS